ncbi:MAG: hypothetical protein WC459_03920 [Patescibacteria group bacterium]
MREEYKDMFIELGPTIIEKCAKISLRDFLDFIYNGKDIEEDRVRRLNFLVEVEKCLEGAYRREDGSIQRWFHRKRKELGNFSPFERLSKWPDYLWSSSADEVLKLAKSLGDGNAT